jgi:hypothetical protein
VSPLQNGPFLLPLFLHARQWQAHGAALGDVKSATGAKSQDAIHVRENQELNEKYRS